MKNLLKLFIILFSAAFLFSACEGPMGPAGAAGADGSDGADGIDANETCKLCHNKDVVTAVAAQYEISKHGYSELHLEEAGNTSCAPCHEGTGFLYVVANDVPSTYTKGSSGTYSSDYKSSATATYGAIDCFTCHSSLHSTYNGTDFSPLTTTKAVSLAMWAGAKSVDLTLNGGSSNLCVKCHQPRPMSTNSKSTALGNVMDYDDLAANPTDIIYDQAIGNGSGNILIPSYRTHVHYGTVGTVFAGVGGVEFDGSLSWASSPHTTKATCQNCHMAEMNGAAGGHSFWAKGNFKGCNVTDCHASAPLDDKSAKVVDTQKAIKKLLDDLAAEINAVGGGTDILHKDPENLWAASTTNHYDGYLDMYDAGSNPSGYWQNPNPSTSWTDAQKTENLGKPLFPSLTKGVLGAMINFQMALREASLGMHNTAYTKALLQNSIDAI